MSFVIWRVPSGLQASGGNGDGARNCFIMSRDEQTPGVRFHVEGKVHRLQFIDDMTCYDDSIEVCALRTA